MTDPVAQLAARAGILASYADQTGRRRQTSRDTQLALLQAMGLGVDDDRQATERLAEIEAQTAGRTAETWIVVEIDRPAPLPAGLRGDWSIRTEDGDEQEGSGATLPPLPLGIHTLTTGGAATTILSAPASLPLPPRGWGLTAPLWGLRGPDRPGFGDFDDLRRAGEEIAGHGAAFLGINPVHAGFPLEPDWTSPYSPSHRRWLNTLHIATEGGAAAGARVDYRREVPAKRAALRAYYEAFASAGGDPAFDAFIADKGGSLRRFAAHQALSERYGSLWTNWPAAARSPDTAPLEGLESEIRFHAWLQWTAHRQLIDVQRALTEAGMRYGLYLDLAVGTHPAGAETWTDRSWFASGVSLGAPPDPFAPDGQRWNLSPFNPRALVDNRFRPLAATLRHQFAYARLLRIDHILGFDRAFWVPETSGLPGAYVRMPRDAMLAVVRIEAARAGATVIGEDLGNIPDGLQDALAVSGILGCRLVQFEHDEHGFRPPEAYRAASLASFGTHDLPTFKGWRAGADIAARAALGHIDDKAANAAQEARARQVREFRAAAGGATVDRMHRFLSQSGATLVAVQAEDVLEVAEQTNLPGTIDEYPNWLRTLPVDADGLGQDPRLVRTAAAMRRAGR